MLMQTHVTVIMVKNNIDFQKPFKNQHPSVINNTIAEVVQFYSKLRFLSRFKNNFVSSITLVAFTIYVASSKILFRHKGEIVEKSRGMHRRIMDMQIKSIHK